MDAREVVLGRVRRALADVPAEETPERVAVERTYLDSHQPADAVALLAENLADYRAVVHRASGEALPGLVAELLAGRGAASVVVPAGLPAGWLAAVPPEVRRVADEEAVTARELDAVDSVVTGCAVAIAETGTLVLDAGPDQGRRRITLVPDHHVCVVRVPEQVVDSVPQGLRRLDPARPLTWISGPSATSDIELNRVEGVHGPRRLDVVLLGS
ncbi:lactate utilization protein C [Streptomyces sp. 3MP-14]|uniref:Lactate utilization protein C n=1 Tax=Streptomyces mimosae TaxID=2586635 RepID=A0A5N6A5K7_9ACTN|nr:MULTISPECIES: LUD domain-containing protein [Streptomyces]KAB8163010.1 lactate utilization protein C [Streptomyces mimosae]KAB8179225.1 lactate utilization protein C [Streptomyces sp. 3MP-14]